MSTAMAQTSSQADTFERWRWMSKDRNDLYIDDYLMKAKIFARARKERKEKQKPQLRESKHISLRPQRNRNSIAEFELSTEYQHVENCDVSLIDQYLLKARSLSKNKSPKKETFHKDNKFKEIAHYMEQQLADKNFYKIQHCHRCGKYLDCDLVDSQGAYVKFRYNNNRSVYNAQKQYGTCVVFCNFDCYWFAAKKEYIF